MIVYLTKDLPFGYLATMASIAACNPPGEVTFLSASVVCITVRSFT